MTRTLAIALEAVGAVTIMVGIVIEVTAGAALGYIIITSGSLGIAVGSLIFAKLLEGRW